jgi:hypothetical protein
MNVFNAYWIGSVGIGLPTASRGYEILSASELPFTKVTWRYAVIPTWLGRFLVWSIFSRFGVLS